MPEISRFYGLVILMYYNDHEPPHFHVRYQDYEITINIDTGEVKGKMSRTALKLVYKWMDLHKKELLDNWELCKQRKPLIWINPLD